MISEIFVKRRHGYVQGMDILDGVDFYVFLSNDDIFLVRVECRRLLVT